MAARRIDHDAVAEAPSAIGHGTALTTCSTSPGDVPADADLVAQCAKGDVDAYRILVERHLPWVMGIARLMLKDDGEAEDVGQETMFRLWNKAKELDIGESGLRPWLRRVTSNLCLDRLRSLKSKATTVTDKVPESAIPASQLSDLGRQELSTRVDLALNQLPDRQRLALVLFHFEGLSQKEITQAMALSQDGVESLLARARVKLKALLQDDWKLYLPDVEP